MAEDRMVILPSDGLTVGDLIARLAAIHDFDAVVQFTNDDETFYIAHRVDQWHDGGVVVSMVNPWADVEEGSTEPSSPPSNEDHVVDLMAALEQSIADAKAARSRIPEGFVACTHDWVRCASCRQRVLTGSEDQHRCAGDSGSEVQP